MRLVICLESLQKSVPNIWKHVGSIRSKRTAARAQGKAFLTHLPHHTICWHLVAIVVCCFCVKWKKSSQAQDWGKQAMRADSISFLKSLCNWNSISASGVRPKQPLVVHVCFLVDYGLSNWHRVAGRSQHLRAASRPGQGGFPKLVVRENAKGCNPIAVVSHFHLSIDSAT